MNGVPNVAVVVPAFGDEPVLGSVVAAILASRGVEVDLAVVDNGFECPDLADWAADERITWVRPGYNTGFTGGCNRGAAATEGDVIAFVNSDAVVAPDALRNLADALALPDTGLATGCVVLNDDPGTVNAAGNPVHYSLLSWAGGWGDPVGLHQRPTRPASVSGALFAVHRRLWQQLGGFHEELFAYGEDVELSLRVAMAGLAVRYTPDASAAHHYEFHRNPAKYYLLERNRLVNLFTLYEWPTLVALGPGLLAIEFGIIVTAIREKWWREKVRGYRWMLAHRGEIRARRRTVQDGRVVSDGGFLGRLELAVAPSERSGSQAPPAANTVITVLGRLGVAARVRWSAGHRARPSVAAEAARSGPATRIH